MVNVGTVKCKRFWKSRFKRRG